MNKPTTFAELLDTCRSLYTNGHTFENWQEFKEIILNEKDYLKSIIAKETVKSLKRFTYHADNKQQAVNSVFSSISQYIVIGESFSYSPFDETSEQALKRITDKYTAEDYYNYKEKLKAEREAKEKALNNPETLDEFRQFINRKGESALNDEQRIKYDELTADTRKAAKEREEQRKAQVAAVENVNAEFIIKQSFHAKKNIPLWVVQMNNRVERNIYEELNNRAKKLGGYYSSYRGNGAIAGFTFETLQAAELFTQVKSGNVDASELKQEETEAKQQSKAEALKEKGQKIIEAGNEELNREKQDNTHRRAAMAANAENKAAAAIQFGKTLVKIAEAMGTNEIKYLDKISNGKDLEQLQNILASAKSRHIRAENLNYSQYEINLKTVNFAELPHPYLYNGSMKRELNQMLTVSGKKMAAARMIKRLASSEFILINTPQKIEDYETIFCRSCSVIASYSVDIYKESLMPMKRLKRIGIDTIEELRAALRELLTLKNGAELSEEQKRELKIKELERQFIGAKIDGFFPTPKSLASYIVKLANIQEGQTVLEPSAGLGHLADEIKALHTNNELQCIEVNYKLSEALQAKGYNVENEDFLNHTCKYDKIVMNPPFENLQDVAHVKHAFNLLNSGGRLVAIMANNKHRSPEFLGMVEQYGTMEENPVNSFSSAFRPTGVSTITVVLDKP